MGFGGLRGCRPVGLQWGWGLDCSILGLVCECQKRQTAAGMTGYDAVRLRLWHSSAHTITLSHTCMQMCSAAPHNAQKVFAAVLGWFVEAT